MQTYPILIHNKAYMGPKDSYGSKSVPFTNILAHIITKSICKKILNWRKYQFTAGKAFIMHLPHQGRK